MIQGAETVKLIRWLTAGCILIALAVAALGPSHLTRLALACALAGLLVVRFPRGALKLLRSIPGRLVIGFLAMVAILDLQSRGSWWQVLGAVLSLAVFIGLVLLLESRFPAELLAPRGPQELLIGCALGIVLGLLSMALAGRSMAVSLDPAMIGRLLAAALFAGVCEEVLFRGILLRISEEAIGSLAALVVSAGLFAWVHASGQQLDTFVAGLALGACFLATRRLWLAIGGHVAHNFVLDLLSQGNSRVVEGLVYRDWLTGLPYVFVVFVLTAWLLRRAYREDHLVMGRWHRVAKKIR